MTCDRCYQDVTIGEHGIGLCPFEPRPSGLVVVPDGIPGGLMIHNLGPRPVKVYSHAERRAIMRARGLREAVYHVDGDKHVGRMI